MPTLFRNLDKFKCRVGLSDHSIDMKITAAAIAVGADVIEKHIALKNQKKGFDINFSLKGKEIKKIMAKTQFKTGQIPWNKDKPWSEEVRMKMIRTMSTPEFRESRRVQRSRIKLPTKDTKPEKIVQSFCKSKKIKFQTSKWYDLGFQRAEVDLFIEPNICILIDGDYIHANPNLIKPDGTMRYPPDRVLHKAYKNRPEKTVLDKWVNDDMITKGLKKQNYKVLRFWEHDILNNPEKCFQKIIKIIKESKRI